MTNPNVRNIDGLPAIMGQFDTFARTTTVRAMADAGITVAKGSFEQGVTGVTQGTGVYQESTGKVFQWQLTNTFNITAGTLPTDYGTVGTDWVDRTNDSLRDEIRETVFQNMKRLAAEAGYNLVDGSFEEGASISGWPDVVWCQTNGKYYQWHLDEAKTVSAGSTPAISGGVGAGSWVDRTSETLRGELISDSGYSLVKGNPNFVPLSRFMTAGQIGQNALDVALQYSALHGVTILGDVPLILTRQISQPYLSKIQWVVECIIDVANWDGSDYVYHIDGGYSQPSYDVAHTWTRAGKTQMRGFRGYASDATIGIPATALAIEHSLNTISSDVVITGANNGGLHILSGYEAQCSNMSFIVTSARSETAIGLNITTSDNTIRDIFPIGYAQGFKCTTTTNTFDTVHAWGNLESGGIGAIGKMHIGFEFTSSGGYNSCRNLYSDTLARINTSIPASRTNGGVGFIIDGWQNDLDGCLSNAGVGNPANSMIPMIISGRENKIAGFDESQQSVAIKPYVVFEGNATPLNNRILGGTAEKVVNNTYGDFTATCNFLTSLSFKSNQTVANAVLSFSSQGSTTIKSGTSTDLLTINLPSWVTSNTCYGEVSIPSLIYTFRRGLVVDSKTSINAVVGVITPGSAIMRFKLYYSDGTASNYLTANYITATGESVYSHFSVNVQATTLL